MTMNVQTVKERANALEGLVVTVYLDTDPRSDQWKIRLKNGLKTLCRQEKASDVCEQLTARVERQFLEAQRHLKNGAVCFVSTEETIFEVTQVPVGDSFYVQEGAALEPLLALEKRFPNTGIVVAQRDQLLVIDTVLGEPIEEIRYEFDVDTDEWVRYRGVAYGAIISSSANHRDTFDDRMKERHAIWYRKIAPRIQKRAKEAEWERVYFVGHPVLTTQLEELLPHLPEVKTIDVNYGGRPVHEVVEDVLFH